MLPDWENIKASWPLIAAAAGLSGWLKVEVTMARKQSQDNADKLTKLSEAVRQIELDSIAKINAQAVQLGRIEEALEGIGRMLARLEKQIDTIKVE